MAVTDTKIYKQLRTELTSWNRNLWWEVYEKLLCIYSWVRNIQFFKSKNNSLYM